MDVTTLDELREYSGGTVVELPPFSDDQPFVARLRRPNVSSLLVDGGIPNELMHTAMILFAAEEDKDEKTEEEKLEDIRETQRVLQYAAEQCLVSPTYEEIRNAGLELTDAQLTGIYNFLQTGVRELAFFRKKQQKD